MHKITLALVGIASLVATDFVSAQVSSETTDESGGLTAESSSDSDEQVVSEDERAKTCQELIDKAVKEDLNQAESARLLLCYQDPGEWLDDFMPGGFQANHGPEDWQSHENYFIISPFRT